MGRPPLAIKRPSQFDTALHRRQRLFMKGSSWQHQQQQALTAFAAEEQKLQQAHHSAAEMLRKLTDFLSVPARIRPILSFDSEQLFDPQRFSALE